MQCLTSSAVSEFWSYSKAKLCAAHAGQLTGRKDAIVSNVALTRVGLGLGLQRFIALSLDAYEFADGLPGAVRRFACLCCVKVALGSLENNFR